MKYDRVIFVCQDNTCRSIMAEAIMNSIKKEDLEIMSRGVVVLFSEPINPKVVPILKNYGLEPMKESSQELQPVDIAPCTLVLTMTAREKKITQEHFPKYPDIYTMGEYSGQEGDIEEPRSGSLADYGACYEYIDFIVKMIAEKIFD